MKNKILFAVKNMNVGGVEKSLLSLLNTMDQEQYEVDLLLLEDFGGFMTEIPGCVNVIICKEYAAIKDAVNLPPIVVIKNYIQRKEFSKAVQLFFGYLRAKSTGHYELYYQAVFRDFPVLEKHYDVAIAYTSIISYLTWLVNYHVKADKRIGWIHFDISKLFVDHNFMRFLHQDMERIYVVSKDALDAFTAEFPELKEKCELRYNVVDRATILRLAEEPSVCIREPDMKTILTLGRLSTEKGQDIIPEVAAQLKSEGLRFKWYLIGDGSLRKIIEEKCIQYGIENNVVLLGTKINPYPYLRQADLYVQTSVHEGYCITLAEAKVFGMPIVSSEFAGAYEQLNGLTNSRIVEREVQALSEAVAKLIM